MYTVKNKSAVYTVIDVNKNDKTNKVIRIYLDNLAIEVITDKASIGY